MRRDPPIVVAALAAVVFASALAVVLVVGLRHGGSTSEQLPGKPLRVRAALLPRTQLFGDTVTARIELAADARRVDPTSIRVHGGFAPYGRVGSPRLERRRLGSVEYIVWTTRLRCLAASCVPPKKGRRVMFSRASVSYSLRRGDRTVAGTMAVSWPALLVYSRVDPVEVAAVDPRDEPPWQADYRTLPPVSYNVSPSLLAGLLYGGGGLLIAAALVLVAPLVTRERREVVRARPRRVAWLPPLEQALALLEAEPVGDGDVEPRRQALEQVAEALGQRGERDLEHTARQLAWSEEPPPSKDTRALAQTVRGLTGKQERGSSG